MLDKLDRFVRVSQARMTFIHADVFLDTAQHSQLRLHTDAFGVGLIDDALCNLDVFLEWLMTGVDHDGAVKTRGDTIVARFLVAMVEMHGKDRLGKHAFGCANYRFEHPFVGIFSRAFGKLNDKRRLTLHIAAKKPEALLHIVNVICADREFAVGDFVKLSGSNDHRIAD